MRLATVEESWLPSAPANSWSRSPPPQLRHEYLAVLAPGFTRLADAVDSGDTAAQGGDAVAHVRGAAGLGCSTQGGSLRVARGCGSGECVCVCSALGLSGPGAVCVRVCVRDSPEGESHENSVVSNILVSHFSFHSSHLLVPLVSLVLLSPPLSLISFYTLPLSLISFYTFFSPLPRES